MIGRLSVIVAATCLVWSLPATAQFGPCAGLADPRARLECYDRQASPSQAPQAAPQRQAPQGSAGGSCTPTAPCVGPRGGVYYYTASGNKRYLPRR